MIDRRRTLFAVLFGATCALALGCGSPPPRVPVPPFPTPVPEPTSAWVLPDGMVISGRRGTQGEVFDRIVEALDRGGFTDWSVYSFADDGFAVVTRMEAIQADGRPTTTRFGVRRPAYRHQGFAIDDLRQVLFNAPGGRYRVLVLVVSARAADAPSRSAPDLEDVDYNELASGKLPDDLRELPAVGRCLALVYELTRPTDAAQPAQLVAESPIDARTHVIAAGLWRAESLK
ncbi:MAG: hypothetical protein WKG00_05475 [Polyangiaceae bacterium]